MNNLRSIRIFHVYRISPYCKEFSIKIKKHSNHSKHLTCNSVDVDSVRYIVRDLCNHSRILRKFFYALFRNV